MFIPPRDSGEGGPPKAVGGARAATLLLRRQRRVESEAPSTAQTRGPPPPLCGGGCIRSRSRERTPGASDAKQRCRTASLRAKRSNPVGGRYPPPAVTVSVGLIAPRGPVVMPAGRFGPEPPRSKGDSPARGNRTRSSPPVSPGGVLSGQDLICTEYNVNRDNCQIRSHYRGRKRMWRVCVLTQK